MNLDFININFINTMFIFLLGTVIGSFLNVVIYRLPRELSVAKGRSMCPGCNKQLKWYELIPLLSYIALRGKCSKCKNKISIQYPLVELLTGIMYVLVYRNIIASGDFKLHHILLFVIVSFVVVGILTDFLYHGAFDFSTIWLSGIFFIYMWIETQSFRESIVVSLQSLVFVAPILMIALLVYFRDKNKMWLSVLGAIVVTVGILYSLIRFNFDITSINYILNSFIHWLPVCLFIILTDYIIKKCIKNEKFKEIFSKIINWINFIIFSLLMFNRAETLFDIEAIKVIFAPTKKNLLIVVLFTLIYMLFLEIFNSHNDEEEKLDENEEIMDREENKISEYVGDGDLLTLPFIGMLLGYQHVFTFYALLSFTVIAVYTGIFKKGFSYTIPLYPFFAFSVFILMIV